MSTEATLTHTFRAKDGLYYESYGEMREANIRVNQAVLQEKGLGTPFFQRFRQQSSSTSLQTPGTTMRRRVSNEAVGPASVTPEQQPQQPTRRSKRLSREEPEHGDLPDDLSSLTRRNRHNDDDDDDGPARQRRRVVTPLPKKWPLLNENQKAILRAVPDWQSGLQDYLVEEEGVSRQNVISTMRQVQKLASGEGVTYSRWEEGIYFYKGIAVDISCDFSQLYQDAVEFETRHGRDLGNGWLLRHPISKLGNFQSYLLAKQENDMKTKEMSTLDLKQPDENGGGAEEKEELATELNG